MSDYIYDLAATNAQLDELEKIALSPAGTAWAGRLLGAGVGAVAGGAAGRASADPGSKEVGTVRGALLGAGAGLLGGQLATKAGRGQAQRFAQRQLHGVTGYLPGRGLLGRARKGTAKWWQIGKKSKKPVSKKQRVADLQEMKWRMPKGTSEGAIRSSAREGVREGTLSGMLPEKVQQFIANRRAASEIAQRRLAEEGMTSIPGLVKGYAGKSPGKLSPAEVAKLNLVAPGLAMGVGVPGALMASSAADYARTGDEASLGRDIASNVGFAAGGGLPMLAAMGLGTAGTSVGDVIGKGIHRLRGNSKIPENPRS